MYEHQLPSDRITGWRPTVMTRGGYTAEQIAGFQLYEIKFKRLSSQEYGGRTVVRANTPAERESPSITPLRAASPPLRFIELEADTPPMSPPTRSPARFEHHSPVANSRTTEEQNLSMSAHDPCQDASPLQFPSDLSVSPKRIPRKTIGSGTAPKTVRSKSDPLLIWPLEKAHNPERPSRSQSPRKRKLHAEYGYISPVDIETSQIFSPWDTHDPPPSPTMRPRGANLTPSSRKSRRAVRFGGDIAPVEFIELSSSRSHEVLSPRSPRLCKDLAVTISALLGLHDKLTPANMSRAKDWGIWVAKVGFGLYLAARLWNILAAVKDAVFMALEPVFAFCGFVRWVFGK
ncbi:hypothetical protein EJ08DRAFT_424436 [Tothia fuscella]|uniref:Uncharacterized protein n=1 Tax=Tothia fuscella TaxID=1048955 RepID=A0A9P4NJA4_9PEZI|nr:hypothetical protein EJ08DRAFT_424436 [Tothia fuscella]